MAESSQDATRILQSHLKGEPDAADRLLSLVYQELRELAARQLSRERPDHTLQPTALVHEAYLQLIDQKEMNWQGRAHFLAMAATTIRRVLIDHARLHYAGKRGGDRKPITLPDGLAAVTSDPLELMTLDEAMKKLRVVSSRQCDVVECRFFGGLSVEETALVLGFSERTVKTDWRMARAWLLKSMEEHGPPGRHWARMAKKRYASSRLLVGNCMRKEGTRRQRNCF